MITEEISERHFICLGEKIIHLTCSAGEGKPAVASCRWREGVTQPPKARQLQQLTTDSKAMEEWRVRTSTSSVATQSTLLRGTETKVCPLWNYETEREEKMNPISVTGYRHVSVLHGNNKTHGRRGTELFLAEELWWRSRKRPKAKQDVGFFVEGIRAKGDHWRKGYQAREN